MSIKLARRIMKTIADDYSLSESDVQCVWSACSIMSTDPDGCVVSLEDIAGIEIYYDDLAELCDAIEDSYANK